MRHETCLVCRLGTDEPRLSAMAAVAEDIGGDGMHHHHVIECGQCGAWWFSDVVIGAFGQLAEIHRDTVLCDCDENLPQYSRSIVQVPQPESECRCTRADVNEYKIAIQLGEQP